MLDIEKINSGCNYHGIIKNLIKLLKDMLNAGNWHLKHNKDLIEDLERNIKKKEQKAINNIIFNSNDLLILINSLLFYY